MGWFQDCSDAIYLALCAAFNVDPESSQGYARFVPAYLPNATTPQANRDANVCYYTVMERQGMNYDYTEHSVKNGKMVEKKTIPVDALITFYGPNADDDAEHFWSSVQIDTGYGSPRQILRNSRIVLDGTPARPVYLFETEGTYHRRRSDVRVNLNYLSYREQNVSTISAVPEIEIHYQ